jgi:hypothetical protein
MDSTMNYNCGDTIRMLDTTWFGQHEYGRLGVFIGDAQDLDYDYEVWLEGHSDPLSVYSQEIELVSRNYIEEWVHGAAGLD